MKKIIVAALLLSTMACSKPTTPTPTTSTTTNTNTVKRWHYKWSFKKPNDNNIYAGSACYTPDEMATEQQVSGAYDVTKWEPC